MKPRILFINHTAQPGGAELSLLDIASHHAQRSFLLLFERGPLLERARQRRIPCGVLNVGRVLLDVSRGCGLARSLRAVPAVVAAAGEIARRSLRFDLLYANTLKSFQVAALARPICSIPLIWHLRDHLGEGHFSFFHRAACARLACACVSRVIANSNSTLEAFVSSGGRRDIATVLHNAIDASPFEAIGPATLRRLRRRLAPPGAPLIGAFGRISPWKGQDVVIRALALLPEVHALIVGDALFGEHAYHRDLLQLTADLKLRHRVHFLGFRSDVPALMRVVDLVVHSSTAPEPFGRVIVEGMLARKPVIATHGGGASEIIDPGSTGILIHPNDPDALAFEIRRLIEQRELADSIAARGFAAASRRFTLPRLHRDLDRVLAEVLSRRPVAPDTAEFALDQPTVKRNEPMQSAARQHCHTHLQPATLPP